MEIRIRTISAERYLPKEISLEIKPQPEPRIFAYMKVGIPCLAIGIFSLILFQNFTYLPNGQPAGGRSGLATDQTGQPKILLLEADGRSRSFPSIQAAIDAAPAHSSVWVDHGRFTESLRIEGKNNLQLRAMAGVTVAGISIQKSQRVEVSGFEIDSGEPSD